MKYQNPIVSGMNPDPSVCRVGDDFYLVNSTFEYFPGIPVYHSTDLVNWEQIGHCLTRDSQVILPKGAANCIGIYAPTIRYHEGTFYCVVTNVGSKIYNGNFYVWTNDPYGEWSDPIYLDFEGIDPSLFFDDDGKAYYIGAGDGIYICEIDIKTGEKRDEVKTVWYGSGANNPEGPHLYKINGMYYLMLAEGGTESGHMETIARSKNIYGPYIPCQMNPILTNRGTDLPIKAIGHADLVDDKNGNWWAVCLGIRPISYPFRHNLGRETMLVPVKWINGWPVMGSVDVTMEVPCLAGEKTKSTGRYVPGSDVVDNFKGDKLHPSWNYIYNPVDSLVELSKDGLILHGNENGLSVDDSKAILCRRQEHFEFEAEMTMHFEPKEACEAGITIYMNPRHHYEAAVTMLDGQECVMLRRRIGSLQAIEKVIPLKDTKNIKLRLTGDKNKYEFGYSLGDDNYTILGAGETSYITTEVGGCFTGNYIGIYASGTKDAVADALITEFTYSGK